MLLDFPNLETLQLALSSGVVPKELAAQGADVRYDEDGRVLVAVDGVTRATAKELKQLGVKGRRAKKDSKTVTVSCWPQILPLQADSNRLPEDDKTPVLFDLPDDGLLAEVVNEVLRLGNDRQAYRAIQANGDDRILLRVVGPPYYSLLRALERDGRAESPRAFVEQNDRVWVQVGYRHPLADKFHPPPGQVLLIAAPNEWRFVEEARFREIYEAAELRLPESSETIQSINDERAIDVPLSLVRGGSEDVAELWVLHENGPEKLDAYVQSAEDKLIARLAFAVGEIEGRQTVVLRLRPGRGAPPVLVLDALECATYLKLPNLYLPTGRRLHPLLRRDVVKSLLAADEKSVTWLMPGDDGAFTPQTMPESTFRPLSDWVRYVIDREHELLEAWIQSTRFDFESFICPDDDKDKPKKPTKEKAKAPKKPKEKPATKRQKADQTKSLVGKLFGPKSKKTEDAAAAAKAREPSELEKRKRALQVEFLESDDPLDAPAREYQWRELAAINTALDQRNDATACWTHAFWETAAPDADELREWFRLEARGWEHGDKLFDNIEAVAHHFDDLLSAPNPAPSSVNAAAVFLIWHTASENRNVDFDAQLGGLQQLFERHELNLPIRTAWLVWRALAKLAGDDVLMLARARDRLLGRLLQRGLVPNQDLPSFLHHSGAHTGERMRLVRDQLVSLHTTARDWSRRTLGTAAPETVQYVDLIFAWGTAKLGESTFSDRLSSEANAKLARNDVHSWLSRAFDHRIQQAQNGQPSTGQLPESLLKELDEMDRMNRHVADRLRQQSNILEPHERVDPYRRWHKRHTDELSRRLSELGEIFDREELASQLNQLMNESHSAPASARIVKKAMELAPRLGEAVAADCLPRVQPLLKKLATPVDRATLLERGLFLASHFDQQRHVRLFLEELQKLLHRKLHTSLTTIESMEAVLSQSLRGLRRMGMRDEIFELLSALDTLVHEFEKGVTNQKAASGRFEDPLPVLIQIAGGWLFFGREENAWPILDRVRSRILDEKTTPVKKTHLAARYLTALGQAQLDDALPRVTEIFQSVDGITTDQVTDSHFGLRQLAIVEATMLAMVSDDFTHDKDSRRWMDDDEYLVRRRIHRDVREMTG